MRDGPRDHSLDTGLTEGRQSMRALVEPRHQAIKLWRNELVLKFPGWSVSAPALVRGRGFVRADEHPISLLAEIAIRIRVAYDRQLLPGLSQGGHRLSDHVVME